MSFRIIRPSMKIPNLQVKRHLFSTTRSTYSGIIAPRWSCTRNTGNSFGSGIIARNNKQFSTSSSSFSEEGKIQEWIKDLTSRPKKFHYDTIDVERISQLQRILPTRQSGSFVQDVKQGDDLPPSHHLVLFRPKFMLNDLGLDGSATEYNAPPPYTRRMWAGGSMTWSDTNRLKIGQEITQIVTVPRVEFKKDMIFVNQQLLIYPGSLRQGQGSKGDSDGWAVKEIRTHVFRKEQSAASSSSRPTMSNISAAVIRNANAPKSETCSDGSEDNDSAPVSFSYTPNSPLLFLYSALTFNPHKVHYDHPWTVEREGHVKPLVHGPLTATLLVELADRIPGKKLKDFRYRATSPMVIGKEIAMVGQWSTSISGEKKNDNPPQLELMASQSGKVGMKAEAEYY